MDILVVAIAKKTVDQFIGVLESAGLEVVGLEIESIAQARCLLNNDVSGGSVLIIDMDERRTGFFISSKGIPCFTSSVPISGQSINNSIVKALGVSLEEAEKIKLNYGIGSDFKNSDIFACTKPILENLVAEIERSIEFFLSELKYSENIEKIIICGKEAGIKGICPYLSMRLGRKVILGDPWVNVYSGKNLPEIDRYKSVEYSTAIGLALKGLDYENTH
jgi:type IV pilus assembly protein PilM